MSAATPARPTTTPDRAKKRSVGAEPYTATPHFFFRALARWLNYTEHAILGLILDSTSSWRKGKWKSQWRFQSVDRLAERTVSSKAHVWAALAVLESANLIESRKIPVFGTQYRIKLRNLQATKPDERQGLLWDVPIAVDMVQAPMCPGCKLKNVALAYEEGYCPAPHSYFRDLPGCVTYAVWLVVGVILDRTVAANREDEWQTIYVKEFERDASLTRRWVQMALTEAKELGLIGEKELSGGASSYRVYTKRFSTCPKRKLKIIPIDSRHRSAPAAATGEEKVDTIGGNIEEIPQKAAKTRVVELSPIAVLPMLRHAVCGWIGLLPSDVGGDVCRLSPHSDGQIRASARAGPPADRPDRQELAWDLLKKWHTEKTVLKA